MTDRTYTKFEFLKAACPDCAHPMSGMTAKVLAAHIAAHESRVHGPCCTGINGAHTLECRSEEASGERLTCFCCGATFPAIWGCGWTERGSACFDCEPHHSGTPCLSRVGMRLEDTRPV